jgi:hypothetical protein
MLGAPADSPACAVVRKPSSRALVDLGEELVRILRLEAAQPDSDDPQRTKVRHLFERSHRAVGSEVPSQFGD